MIRPFIFTSAVFTIAVCQVFAGADDAKKLQGTWVVVDLIAYGKKVDPKNYKGTKFVITKDKVAIVPPNDKIDEFVKRTYNFKINSAKKPAEIDLVGLTGKTKVTSLGIYELNGDTLRWCQSDATKASARPTMFTSPEKSGIYLFTLKRGK
ncbi:MAG: TIGR03067 domain-containing protein [Planctomycetes bacterium]|nr:TIGR03067 domain-containing protein [Planctomycetota bacterium]